MANKIKRFSLIMALGLITLLTGCSGGKANPSAVQKELLPVLVDLAATKRAERCSDLLRNKADIAAAKPFKIEVVYGDRCKLSGTGKLKVKAYGSVGGFAMKSYDSCADVRKHLKEGLPRHENDLRVKTTLFCGKDGKPTMEPDIAVRLAARSELKDRLPSVVQSVNEGKISASISDCYFSVKEQLTKTESDANELRCKVMKHDYKVKGVTYAAIWERAQIYEKLEEYKSNNNEQWLSAQKSDGVSDFFEQFTEYERNRACQKQTTVSLTLQKQAALIAAKTCL